MSNYSKNKIKGATMIEYVLIAGLIALVAGVALGALGPKVSGVFSNSTAKIPS